MEERTAFIAMSGGVDSSVAALKMLEAGYRCTGCTMRLYDYETVGIADMTCCSQKDVEDARQVCEKLGMPHRVLHYEEAFRKEVIERFADAYVRGETPNPCIDCNRYIKFAVLYEEARAAGCDKIVTGHYARIAQENGRYVLKKAKDLSKDQSYVLYNLTQDNLAHTAFPLGEMTKAEARDLAAKHGFGNAEKKDSQDICFVPHGDYAAVIESVRETGDVPGNFVDGEGNVLGTHKGITHYTLGQRRGLGLSLKEPFYVCRLDVEKNEVVLSREEGLFHRTFLVEDINWISGEAPAETIIAKAKVRYRQAEKEASITPLSGTTAEITFTEPERAITPGQSAVFYENDTVLGGGIIRRVLH